MSDSGSGNGGSSGGGSGGGGSGGTGGDSSSGSGGGSGGSGTSDDPPPAAQPRPGSIQFESTALSAEESGGVTVTFKLTRTDGSDGAVSVTIERAGTATDGSDYTIASRTTSMTFDAGDTATKEIQVLVADDGEVEDDETLTLALTSATGGVAIGTNASATLAIKDNDVPAAPKLNEATADIKQLKFSWPSVAGATSYRLLEDPDGASGFTTVRQETAATNAALDIAAHQFQWVNARYAVQACNTHGCSVPSAPIGVANVMLDAIGYFKASNTGVFDSFGIAVALSGDGNTLAVGADLERSLATGVDGDQTDNSGLAIGAAYVFARTGNQWTQQAYIKASNTGDGGSFGLHFGLSLALSEDGNTLAIGARDDDSGGFGVGSAPDPNDNSIRASGAVYVYERSGTQWSLQAYVKAIDTHPSDMFGTSVDLSADGDTLAVGAMSEDSATTGVGGNPLQDCSVGGFNCAGSSGAVYIYKRSGTQWSYQTFIKASNTGSGDSFGSSLALSADGRTLAVGAHLEDSAARGINGNQGDNGGVEGFDSGAVYVYSFENGEWSQQAYVKPSNTRQFWYFGTSVALSGTGDTLAVGARGESSRATGINGDQQDIFAEQAGAVYVYTRADGQWSQQAYVKASNTELADQFGFHVALSEDGNTLAVAAIGEDSIAKGIGGAEDNNGTSGAGAVYLYKRVDAVWEQHAYVKASNTKPLSGFFGAGFGMGLDVSADGGTLAVGAWAEDSSATGVDGNQNNNGTQDSGAVYLY